MLPAPAFTVLESVFLWVVETSWQASLLVGAVLLIQKLFRNHLNPRWSYALWLLVLARLTLPQIPSSIFSIFQVAPSTPLIWMAPAAAGASLPGPSIETNFITLNSLLALIWISGAAVFLLITLWVNHRFHRQMKARLPLNNPRLLALLQSARAQLGLTCDIKIIEHPGIGSPAIMGLFHPILLLPLRSENKFSDAEWKLIFLHELAHLKRGDTLVQWLIALLQILHWFNPVLWFAFRCIRRDREPATDALVLSQAGESEKQRYGEVLIKLLEHFQQRHALPGLVGILEEHHQFKKRFQLIARFTQGAYGWSLLAFFLAAGIATVFLTREPSVKSPETPAFFQAQQEAFERIRKKSSTLKLGPIRVENMALSEFMAFLSKKTREADPEKIGINFVVKDSVKTPNLALSVSLDNPNLDDVLDLLERKYPLECLYEPYAIFIIRSDELPQPFITKSFAVSREFASAFKEADRQVDMVHALARAGIPFPSGTAAVYLPKGEKFVVRNTEENVARIEEFLRAPESHTLYPQGTKKHFTIQTRLKEGNVLSQLPELELDNGTSSSVTLSQTFRFPTEFTPPKKVTYANQDVFVPATPTEFNSVEVGWKIEYSIKQIGDFLQINGKAMYTPTPDLGNRVYGEKTGPIRDEKSDQVVLLNDTQMPIYQASTTYFQVNAKPGKPYWIKLSQGDKIVEAEISCQAQGVSM